MSWLFSRALVAEYSAVTSLAGKLCAQLNTHPIPQAYCSPDRMTEFSRLSRFGMTFEPLTEDRGEELLTWFLAGFRAKTSAPQEKVLESKANAADCGNTWHELSMRYDPATLSWKTAHCLWEEDLPWSSVTLPRWGMTQNGFVFQHPTAERPISATASGLWPTATANNFESKDMDAMLARRERVKAKNGNGFGLTLGNAVRLWPTPTCASADKEVVSSQKNNNLVPFVKMFPTPTATDGKGAPSIEKVRERARDSKRGVRLPEQLARDGQLGQLNPTWVEWLMGWPLGWTDLKPLGMDKFQEWRQQHSICF
jgi:hypothetical protein